MEFKDTPWARRRRRARLMFRTFVLGSIAIVGAGVFFASNAVYSEGSRTGVVSKISNKGLFCKTYEGELVMGGLRNTTSISPDGYATSSVSANVFDFSVVDPVIVDKIVEASRTGERATLYYDQKLLFNPCTQKTGYVITNITTTPQLRGYQQ